MFASNTTDTVMVGEVSVTIRMLSHTQLHEAAFVRAEKAARAAALFAHEVVDAMRDAAVKRAPVEQTPEQKREARYAGYDRSVVLRSGVKSWSEKTKKLPGALDDLDEDSADFLHKKILDLTLPEITEAENEEKTKND